MDVILQVISIAFWFIVILLPLVSIHEFGHLLMARLMGVKVLEYGIGIPPRWKYVRWKGIIWSLNYVLLGGFARIYGDHDALDEAQETAKTDQKKAREEYTLNRFEELVANQEIPFFLEENNIEYSEEWQDLVKSKYLTESEKAPKEKIEQYEALTKQLKTLVSWEFDTKISSKEAFFSKNWFQQALIILGGVTFNMLSAIIFILIMVTVTGSITQVSFMNQGGPYEKYGEVVYQSEFVKVPQVIKDSPAYQAGIRPGDDLIRFATVEVNTLNSMSEFRELVQTNKGKEVQITYRSKETGEIKDSTITLENPEGNLLFGVGGLGYEIRYKAKDFFSGVQLAVTDTFNLFTLNFKVLGQVVTALLPQTEDRTALENVSGPIAISSFSSRIFRDYGAAGILYLLALISIGLAVFNILPLPALDGGRLVILTLNKITGKRNKRFEAVAISFTFFLLLGLAAVVAVRDIQGIVQGKF